MNRRTLFPLTLILILLAPFVMGFGPPRQQENPIQLALEAGYGGRFRPGMWLPLLLTIANDGPGVSGALRVRAENNAGLNATTYRTPIDLPRQSRKQVFLYVSLQPFARQIQVELVNTSGEVLQTIGSQLYMADPGDLLSAIVTDSPAGSVDLTGVSIGEGGSFQSNWSAENIPALPDALLGLDVLLFSDVDTGQLSLEQQRAIKDWVLAGGHLIVTGGPNYRLTTAGLADLLPVEIGGTTTTSELTALADYVGRYDDILREPDVIMTTGEQLASATTLVEVDGEPLLARRHYGEGIVDYLAVDPGLAPIREWRGKRELWQTLAVTPNQRPGWSEGFRDWDAAERVVQQSPGFDLPSALQMFGMLALYILMIGPVNYLALRITGRRELAWVTIPALVVVFSILAYFTGFSLRGTRATLNRLSVVQVWPDSDRAQVDGLLGVLSPRRTTYRLAAPPGLTLRPLVDSSSTTPIGLNSVQQATEIEQGSVHSASNVLVDASLIAGFATTGFIDDAPHIDGEATFKLDSNGSAQISGRLTNTTGFALEDAVILAPGGFQQLGLLEPEETAAFDLPLTAIYSAQVSLKSGENSSLFYEQNLNTTTRDILGVRYDDQPYYVLSSLEERLLRQRQNFLNALISDRDFSGGRGDRVFLLGWAKTAPLDMTLEGAAWIPEDLSLYIFEVPVSREAPEDATVVITPQFSTWITTEETTIFGARPYNLSLNGGEQVGFRFTPLNAVRLAHVTRLDITVRRASPTTASVYAWDWTAEDWEKVNMNNGIRATIDDPAVFIGPENAVKVLVIPDDVNNFTDFAQIDVTWHGTFQESR